MYIYIYEILQFDSLTLTPINTLKLTVIFCNFSQMYCLMKKIKVYLKCHKFCQYTVIANNPCENFTKCNKHDPQTSDLNPAGYEAFLYSNMCNIVVLCETSSKLLNLKVTDL